MRRHACGGGLHGASSDMRHGQKCLLSQEVPTLLLEQTPDEPQCFGRDATIDMFRDKKKMIRDTNETVHKNPIVCLVFLPRPTEFLATPPCCKLPNEFQQTKRKKDNNNNNNNSSSSSSSVLIRFFFVSQPLTCTAARVYIAEAHGRMARRHRLLQLIS